MSPSILGLATGQSFKVGIQNKETNSNPARLWYLDAIFPSGTHLSRKIIPVKSLELSCRDKKVRGGRGCTASFSEAAVDLSTSEFDFHDHWVHRFIKMEQGHLGGELLTVSRRTKRALVSEYESPFKSTFIRWENLQSKLSWGDLVWFWGKITPLDLLPWSEWRAQCFYPSGFNNWKKPGCFKLEETANEACHCL